MSTHPCPGCGRPIKTTNKPAKRARSRLCLACRIDQKTLPAPLIEQSHYPQYLCWLKGIAQHIKEISR